MLLEFGDGGVAAAEAVESVSPRERDVVVELIGRTVASTFARLLQGIEDGERLGEMLRVVQEEGLCGEGVSVVG